jgi:hydrogenase maturation protease
MMRSLRDELVGRLRGRVCLVGVGNPDRSDDAVGVRLAEAMRALGCPDVILAERSPERWLGWLARGEFHTVVFLDAVEMGAAPGAVVFLDGAQIAGRYPQLSTHKISLGTLARLIEADGPSRAFLLGVQPQSVAAGNALSPPVQETLHLLRDVLAETLALQTESLFACGD